MKSEPTLTEPEAAPIKLEETPSPQKEIRSTPTGITRTIRTVKPTEVTSKDAYDLYFTGANLQVIEGVGPKIAKIPYP